jgi:hypothetical protein
VTWLACQGFSFLTFALCAFRREHWGRTCPLKPQWWHIRDLLVEGGFWVPWTSPLSLSFPLSSTVGGGSGTVGLKKTVLEVEGVSVGGATYPRPVCRLGSSELIACESAFHRWLSNWSCVSSNFSSSSCIFRSKELSSVYNCSDHEDAAYVRPSAFHTLYRKFCMPFWVHPHCRCTQSNKSPPLIQVEPQRL